jgi:hypothetical protein
MVVTALAGLLLAPQAANAQSQNPSVNTLGFNIELPDNVERSHDRWFKFRVDPSSDDTTVQSSFTLSNALNERVEFRLDAVDSMTNIYGGTGGFTPLVPSGTGDPIIDVVNEVGRWITIDNAVVLNGGESREIPFSVNVPATARPGVNLGGISIWIPQSSTKPRESADPGEVATPITVVNRRVIGVEVVTPSVLAPQLRVNGVKAVVGASGLALDMSIENLGTDYAVGSGQIEVTQGGFSREFALDEVIPGDTIAYRSEWTADAPPGLYDATVRIAYGEGLVATWSGTFELGEELLAEARARATDENPAKSGMPVWAWIAIILATVLLLVIAIILGRKILIDRLVDEDDEYDEEYDWSDDPLTAGVDPDSREPITAGRGRFLDDDVDVQVGAEGTTRDP